MKNESREEEFAIRKVIGMIDKRRDDIVRFLSHYVQEKSVNATIDNRYSEGECQKWLSDQFSSWNCFAKVDLWEKAKNRPNLVITIKGSHRGQALAFLGHSDVVPVVEETLHQWTVDPWKGEVKDGRVYGRGACDMKGGNVASIWAMKLIAETGVRLRKDVYGAIVIGEETGEHEIGVDEILERGYKPQFVVCAEPTNSRICPVSPGFFTFKLTVHGKAIHTSQRYKCTFPQRGVDHAPGVDAIQKTVKFLQAFEELEREWGLRKHHPILPPGASNLTPTLIKGGEYIVALAERCEVIFDVWYHPDETFESVAEELRAFVRRISENDDWLRDHPPTIEIPARELPVVVPPIDVPLDHPGCKAVIGGFQSALSRAPEFDGFTAGSDVNFLKLKGITGVLLGPGDISAGVHGVDEYLPIQQLIDCCKVYAATIINWCGISSPI